MTQFTRNKKTLVNPLTHFILQYGISCIKNRTQFVFFVIHLLLRVVDNATFYIELTSEDKLNGFASMCTNVCRMQSWTLGFSCHRYQQP